MVNNQFIYGEEMRRQFHPHTLAEIINPAVHAHTSCREVEKYNMFLMSSINDESHRDREFIVDGQHCYTSCIAKGTKRKCKGDDSLHPPVLKQQITDEKMAEGMNNLYINNDYSNPITDLSVFHPDNSLNMAFNSDDHECCVDLQETVELELSIEDTCETEQRETRGIEDDKFTRRDHPVFMFNAPLKQFLKRKTDILPPQIIEEIYKPCLAVIPWTPPLNDKTEDEIYKQLRHKQRHKTTSKQDFEQENEAMSMR